LVAKYRQGRLPRAFEASVASVRRGGRGPVGGVEEPPDDLARLGAFARGLRGVGRALVFLRGLYWGKRSPCPAPAVRPRREARPPCPAPGGSPSPGVLARRASPARCRTPGAPWSYICLTVSSGNQPTHASRYTRDTSPQRSVPPSLRRPCWPIRSA